MSETVQWVIYTPEEKLERFGPGEWVNELDKEEFVHQGIKCEIHRIMIKEPSGHYFGGHLCGYVQIPDGCDFEEDQLDYSSNGGLTYDSEWEVENLMQRWIGFDCAHSGDIVPSTQFHLKDSSIPFGKGRNDSYKNFEYVRQEVKKLAEEVKIICLKD